MTDATQKPVEQSRLRVFLDSDVFYMFKKSPVAIVSTVVFLTLVLSAICAPLIAPTNPFDPASLNLMNGFTLDLLSIRLELILFVTFSGYRSIPATSACGNFLSYYKLASIRLPSFLRRDVSQ